MIDSLWRCNVKPIDLAKVPWCLRLHGSSQILTIRTSARREAVLLSVIFGAFLLSGEGMAQSITLGSCTPGQR